MKVIKNINNNVSICVDGNGNEVIAFGKGIGFQSPPFDIEDMNIIKRTFYDVNPKLIHLINQIDEEVLEIAAMTIDYACKLDTMFDSNVVFTLADHIQFAIKRFHEHLQMKFSLFYDLEYMNPEEVEIGTYAYERIKSRLHITLPKEEIYGIALHLINSQTTSKSNEDVSNQDNIEAITSIIEDFFHLSIDKKGFNYARFVSHMEYVFKRYQNGSLITSMNVEMFPALKSEYPHSYRCAMQVSMYFKNKLTIDLTEEELLYLMLHINRLCSREDCYR